MRRSFAVGNGTGSRSRHLACSDAGRRVGPSASAAARTLRSGTVARACLALGAALAAGAWSGEARAQVVYYSALRPVVAAPVVAAPMVVASPYVANYTPAGNYAAVTAFSPPVAMPMSGVAVTSYYAPAPTVAYYAPPALAAPVVGVPAVVAPVTAYYAPVVAPLYRRGPLGVWRPVRW